jgi:SNF2 family DNA or RNA helicase
MYTFPSLDNHSSTLRTPYAHPPQDKQLKALNTNLTATPVLVAQVTALLQHLGAAPPGSKALVFSSWGRLLRLVGEALKGAGVHTASMVGAAPAARQAALDSFLNDPGCRVMLMLMSNSSGAAGLTLTVADTVYLMEPAGEGGGGEEVSPGCVWVCGVILAS